jgi:hypothetical protein
MNRTALCLTFRIHLALCMCMHGTMFYRYPNHGFLTVQQGITLALSNSTSVPFLNDGARGKAYSLLDSIQLQRLTFPEYVVYTWLL